MSTQLLISLTNKSLLKLSFKESPFFRRSCLVQQFPSDLLNADSSLSNIQDIKTKYRFFQDYKKEYPELGSFKLYYKFFVSFLKFYKNGMKSVFDNFKAIRALNKKYSVNNKDILPGVKNQHPLIRVRDSTQLVKLLSNVVKNFENEYKLTGDIKRLFDNAHQIELTRLEFVKILRTNKDINKLPTFGILFLILEELTVFLCALFPDLTPSNCLIPQLTSRFYGNAAKSQLELYQQEPKITDTAYLVPVEQLHAMVETLQLKSRYLPMLIYPEQKLRDLLQLRWQQICVDNYLIMRDGGVWNMSKLEVIDACLQRGLLDLGKFIESSKSSTENFVDLIDETDLKLRLFSFINNSFLDGVNVGLIGSKSNSGVAATDGEVQTKDIKLYINSLHEMI